MTKAESNRRNALRSTGPRTPAGKAISSRNAVRHGAYAEALAMLLEDQEDFEALRRGLVDTLGPVGPLEGNLVDRMASAWWRMDRTKRAANQTLWMAAKRDTLPTLPPMFPELGLVSESLVLEADECRLAGAWDHEAQERLLRHELTLERSFFRLLHELERLQARRQGQAVLPPVAVDVTLTGARD